jgi:hypothetical protein
MLFLSMFVSLLAKMLSLHRCPLFRNFSWRLALFGFVLYNTDRLKNPQAWQQPAADKSHSVVARWFSQFLLSKFPMPDLGRYSAYTSWYLFRAFVNEPVKGLQFFIFLKPHHSWFTGL